MKLNKADESALIIALTELLQRGEVTSYDYAPIGQGWEDAVFGSLSEDGQKQLKSLLDPSLEGFYQERLFRHFYLAGNTLPEDGKVKLSACKGFAKPLEIAKSFVEHLTRAPHQYRLIMPAGHLFKNFPLPDGKFKISDRLWLFNEDAISEINCVAHGNVHLNERLNKFVKGISLEDIDASHYFVYFTSGVHSNRYASKHLEYFQDELRFFFGAQISSGNMFYFSFFTGEVPSIVYSSMVGEEGTELVAVNAPDSDIKMGLGSVITKSLRDRKAPIGEVLAPAVKLFASEEKNRLSTAAGWVFRANISARPIDRALEAAIAIEVLLGDRETSDRIGLSKLMANRCAYALAKNNKERSELIRQFVSFYKVRSEIVHSGRTKVSDEDASVVSEGVSIAQRLLNHEIRMAS